MRQLDKGMYQLDLPVADPIGQVYAYLIVADKITLIDVGVATKESEEALEHQLAEIHLSKDDIDQIILTHHHYDHWSGIQFFPNDIKIYLHPRFYKVSQMDKHHSHITREALENFIKKLGFPKYYSGENLQVFQVASYHLPFPNLHVVKDGDIIPHTNGLKVMEIPGHATTQIALISEEKNIAFSADALIHNQNLSVWLEQKLPEDSSRLRFMPAYIKTLERLREQRFSKLYPGHGMDIVEIDEQIDMKLAYLEKKKEKVLKQIQVNETQTPWEIYSKLYSKRFIERFLTLTFAETFGILDLLHEEGKIALNESVTPFQVKRRVDDI